jgi:hypothetical protein
MISADIRICRRHPPGAADAAEQARCPHCSTAFCPRREEDGAVTPGSSTPAWSGPKSRPVAHPGGGTGALSAGRIWRGLVRFRCSGRGASGGRRRGERLGPKACTTGWPLSIRIRRGIAPADRQRVTRALEVHAATGRESVTGTGWGRPGGRLCSDKRSGWPFRNTIFALRLARLSRHDRLPGPWPRWPRWPGSTGRGPGPKRHRVRRDHGVSGRRDGFETAKDLWLEKHPGLRQAPDDLVSTGTRRVWFARTTMRA